MQKYIGEGARMVRELFEMARSKKACIIFFDEVDAIGGARFDDGEGGDNEVQRTMLELINQLDGFDARGNIKVIMATNRHVCFPVQDSSTESWREKHGKLIPQTGHIGPCTAPTRSTGQKSRVQLARRRGSRTYPQDSR